MMLISNLPRSRCASAKRILFMSLAAAFASFLAIATPAAAQVNLETAVGRTVQMAHWQAFLESRLSPPVHNPMENIPDERAPPQPSLRDKYDSAPILDGMDLFATAEFRKLRGRLPSQNASALSAWTVVVARCTTSGPALLTSVDRQRKRICIAPILLTSVYIESAVLDRHFRIAGDWNALLAGFSEPAWSRLQRSLDIVLAKALLCGALAGPTASCIDQAFALARQLDDKSDAMSLIAVLNSANSKYEVASWGYETAGDGSTALSELQAAHAP